MGTDEQAQAVAEQHQFLYPVLDENGKQIVGEDGEPRILTPRTMAEKSIDDHALAVAVRRHFLFPILDENGAKVVGEDGKPKTENLWGIDEFTPHDLRRTASTFMAQLGVADAVIDAVLNHVKQGVIKVYNQYRYDKEKQAALEAWELKLREIVS